MGIQTITQSIVGNGTTYATLTAAYTGNRTNPLSIENVMDASLAVHFIPGANNQYADVLIEISSQKSIPTADADWVRYPAIISSASEDSVYGNPAIIPGDKVSTSGTEIGRSVAMSLAFKWIRVGVRELTQAGGAPADFGTIHIELTKQENF